MVQFQLTIPDNPDPQIFQVIDYIKFVSQGNSPSSERVSHVDVVCADLRQKHSNEAVVFHLSAMVVFLLSNYQAAMRFWGQAVVISPNYQFSRDCLDEVIDQDDFWQTTDDYLKALSCGWERVRSIYLQHGHEAFRAGDLDTADVFSQKVSALCNIIYTPIQCLAGSRQESERLASVGKLGDELTATATLHDYATKGAEDYASIRSALSQKDDRRQMAEIVMRLSKQTKNDTPVIFELGSYIGFDLDLVYQTLKPHCRPVCIGLEPNTTASAESRRLYPHIKTLVADHKTLISDALDLPSHIDICLISRVLMVLHPDEVIKILNFLQKCVGVILLCEDIFNVDGDIPVVRRSSRLFCVAHNFRKQLEGAGFEISELIMADIPDRELTGFIVARNKKKI